MQMSAYLLILAVLPAFVIIYFLLSGRSAPAGKVAIIVFSAGVYAYFARASAAVLGAGLLVNLLVSLLMLRQPRFRKALLALAVADNLAVLAWFKYRGFALAAVSGIFGGNAVLQQTVAPLGISFFTLQQIMYVVSVYRGEIKKVNVLDYLCCVLYFPKLITGPLMEPAEFIGQLNEERRKTVDWWNVACGVKLFGFGLFKTLVLADTLARGVAWGFGSPEAATSGDLFLVMLLYALEIYFGLSGCSDMAVGVSKMINITLPINFDSPYKAASIGDFWKRWHITLVSFMKKYVYDPLGGRRKGRFRGYRNLLIASLVCGLWHGANWTFLLWGGIHGLLLVGERIWDRYFKRQTGFVNYLVTFLTVSVLWLLFRAESVAQWCAMVGKMFSFQNMAVSEGLLRALTLPEAPFLINVLDFLNLNPSVRGLPTLALLVAASLICLIPENNYRNMKKLNAANLFLCAAAFVWAFLCLSSEAVFVFTGF